METTVEKINRLRKERNAIILAHYYQNPEIQDIADFMGDSLALAQQAKKATSDVILFCGVHFMAETAKILNPTKTVLVPDMDAGCSLADSCPADEFKKWIDANPGHVVVSYINCTAETKALSDVIVTSSNAEKIIRSIPQDRPILFAPDKYLGSWLMRKTGRQMKLWNGSCRVHDYFSEQAIISLTSERPNAEILAHPECPPNILDYADFVGSTNAIIKRALESEHKEFIILTEPGIIHELEKKAPGKKFYSAPNMGGCSCNECPYMRLNTLQKMADALESLQPELNMTEDLRLRALKPLERMLELS